jgi:hypothetical protein
MKALRTLISCWRLALEKVWDRFGSVYMIFHPNWSTGDSEIELIATSPRGIRRQS